MELYGISRKYAKFFKENNERGNRVEELCAYLT